MKPHSTAKMAASVDALKNIKTLSKTQELSVFYFNNKLAKFGPDACLGN